MTFSNRTRTFRTGCATAGLLLLTSCGLLPSSAQDRDPAHAPELRRFYGQKPHWKDCGEGLQCASLTVPMDYARPRGKTFTLPLVRHPATNRERRLGSLVYNPGGPGASGVEDLKGGTADDLGERIRERFDIVSFDPRGVGGSKPAVTCDYDESGGSEGEGDGEGAGEGEVGAGAAADAGLTLYPQDDAERDSALAYADEDADGCAAGSGSLLRHVGTPDVARDVDVLRAALGDRRITYLGWSYGTYLGSRYAEQFPHRVRAMVLDGAVDPSLTWRERALSMGAGFEQSLDDYAELCADYAGESCPGTTPEEIRDVVDSLYDSVTEEPLQVSDSDETVDIATLHSVVSESMYAPEDSWTDLSDALWQAYDEGDGSLLLKLSDGEELDGEEPNGEEGDGEEEDEELDETAQTRTARNAADDSTEPADNSEEAPDNSEEALMAVNCLDIPHPRSPEAYWDLLQEAHEETGLSGTSSVLDEMSCRKWIKGATKPHRVKAPGLPPTLVVGTTGDPATPYHEAESLAGQLPGGMLLTYEGVGHLAYGRGDACVDKAVDDYLLTLEKVRPGTTC
ncbi:alpha/beta fold hydrolase [Streptomyces sp. NA04227]|uniref:alpha/beta hydrolase n=1 Tax=Streptomyces sp. NA04227 TaxID=2742136 RepID=UPI001590475F|nr:alpha/beta hydrolase [Streptomyces sp. NA04227]QKW07612.1 alpha/beta fold hydrolase [Streptomyces sp. NA04227]